jgi:hypothetical protein
VIEVGEYVDVSCGGETIAVGDVVTLSHSVDVWPGVPHFERGEYVGNFVKGRFLPLWELKTMNAIPCIMVDELDIPQCGGGIYDELNLDLSNDAIPFVICLILVVLSVFSIWFAWVVWVMS